MTFCFFVFPTALYILFSWPLEIALHAEIEEPVSLGPLICVLVSVLPCPCGLALPQMAFLLGFVLRLQFFLKSRGQYQGLCLRKELKNHLDLNKLPSYSPMKG